MPRKVIDEDDEAPRRRRRGAQAAAIDLDEERGLLMRLLLHSPKDMVAGVLAAAAIIGIITNALFLQAGRHPSPMFGSVVTLAPSAPVAAAVSPMPRPRPVEAAAAPPVEPATVETRPVETKPAEPAKPPERVKAPDPMANLVTKSTSPPAATPSNVMRPPASIPSRSEITHTAGSKRIAAVQRALTEYGYGQLKATGTIGIETQNAIAKFEKARKLPVTGQMSDRVVHELASVIGRPIE